VPKKTTRLYPPHWTEFAATLVEVEEALLRTVLKERLPRAVKAELQTLLTERIRPLLRRNGRRPPRE